MSHLERKSIETISFEFNPDKIGEYLKQNKNITNRQGREITGLSATRVKEVFKLLCDKNIIVAHGGNRDRFYTLRSDI